MKKIAFLLSALMLGALSPIAHAEDFSEGAHHFKEDVKEAGKETGHAFANAGHAVAHGAKSAGHAVAHGAKTAGHAVADTTRHGYDKTKQFVTGKG